MVDVKVNKVQGGFFLQYPSGNPHKSVGAYALLVVKDEKEENTSSHKTPKVNVVDVINPLDGKILSDPAVEIRAIGYTSVDVMLNGEELKLPVAEPKEIIMSQLRDNIPNMVYISFTVGGLQKVMLSGEEWFNLRRDNFMKSVEKLVTENDTSIRIESWHVFALDYVLNTKGNYEQILWFVLRIPDGDFDLSALQAIISHIDNKTYPGVTVSAKAPILFTNPKQIKDGLTGLSKDIRSDIADFSTKTKVSESGSVSRKPKAGSKKTGDDWWDE